MCSANVLAQPMSFDDIHGTRAHGYACTRTSDFERPIETLQKIKEKRQKEAEEREEQEAIERGCVSSCVTCVAASQTRSGSEAHSSYVISSHLLPYTSTFHGRREETTEET